MSNRYPIKSDDRALLVSTDKRLIRVAPSIDTSGPLGSVELSRLRMDAAERIALECARRCMPEVLLDTKASTNDRAIVLGGVAVCRLTDCPLGPGSGGAGDHELLPTTPTSPHAGMHLEA